MHAQSPQQSAESPRQVVQKAVETELAANREDHTHWLYYESEREPKHTVEQWVAEAQTTAIARVIQRNGQALAEADQRKGMDSFVRDTRAQARQRKSEEHDDQQATDLLKILPDAFLWTSQGEQGSNTILHFRPDPQFHAPNFEARVFAAMEGDIAIDTAQHRIVTLKGHLVHDVKIVGGLLGNLEAGGTFDVERREIGKAEWQIVETHVHIHGHALIFKSISEEQDDQKSKFRQLPENLSLQQAETELLQPGK